MGIYDRDYYREPRPGVSVRGPSTIIGWIILINVAVYLVDSLLMDHRLTEYMAVHVSGVRGVVDFGEGQQAVVETGTLRQPWLWWQFLTYGFAHAKQPGHIFGNMLVLFFLGREVEARYGSREFLRLYLVMLVFASVVWAVINEIVRPSEALPQILIGASGAVTGVVILFALNFPRRTILLMFLFPIPAWVLGILYVAGDAMGALGWASETRTSIAYGVHLSGAAFAVLYHHFGWNLTRMVPARFSLSWLKPKPRLRVHDPDRAARGQRELSDEVDRILEKISRQGEASLTRKERRILESASREYQQRRRGDG
jgi:membrane associated rhomboid family serine protease